MSQLGANKKISAAAARSHTRKSKPDSSFGIKKLLLLALFAGFCAWAYQTAIPPPPKTCGSPNGPPITSPRIKLRDGRHISYTESGVPKDEAKSKIVYVHCFDCCKYHNPFALASPVFVGRSLSFFSLTRTLALAGGLVGSSLSSPGFTLRQRCWTTESSLLRWHARRVVLITETREHSP